MKNLAGIKVAGLVAALALVGACDGGASGGGGGATGSSGNGTGGGSAASGGNGGGTGYAVGTNIPLPLAPAEITWMHNGMEEPQRSYWEQVAADFEALHPGVNVTITEVPNADLRANAVFNAVDSGTAPDLFQSWGGGQLTEWVNEGVTRDLTEVLAPTISGLSSWAVPNWQLNSRMYGLPYAAGPAGFWVNLNVLNEAGLVDGATTDAAGNVTGGTVDWPTDLAGLFAMWSTIKEHGITPVAVGGGTGWAGPFWYYALVADICPAEAINTASELRDFSDGCWEQAGTKLKEVVGQGAFQSDWSTANDQAGAESSAGLVATGQAAMEFQGPWAGTVMSSIYQNQAGSTGAPGFLAWYPFPAAEPGQGAAILAGGDGFSVLDSSLSNTARSDAAAALLGFILSEQVQTEGLNFNLGGNNVVALPGIPTNQAAAAQVVDPVQVKQAAALSAATHTVPWLDVYLGSTIGSAMNNAVNSLMRGQIGAATVVDSIRTSAGAVH